MIRSEPGPSTPGSLDPSARLGRIPYSSVRSAWIADVEHEREAGRIVRNCLSLVSRQPSISGADSCRIPVQDHNRCLTDSEGMRYKAEVLRAR
jgi:hypothetical protein